MGKVTYYPVAAAVQFSPEWWAQQAAAKAKAKAKRKAGCTCHGPRTHRDCSYCGMTAHMPDHVCGVCKADGIDGKLIRGTGPYKCKKHRPWPGWPAPKGTKKTSKKAVVRKPARHV